MAPSVPFGTFGLGWIDQRVPFHSSTSGIVPELEPELPTAKQTFGSGHETPFSELKVVPGGLGVGTICQLAPSQRSASGPPVGGVEMKIAGTPTAMHELADEQSTAFSVVNEAPSTFGVGVTVQAADATEGVSNSAAVANKTRRTDRSDIRPLKLRLRSGRVNPTSALRALHVSWLIAEDGHPVTARRCKVPRKRCFGREAALCMEKRRFAWKAAV
jgi:hypothetical protein